MLFSRVASLSLPALLLATLAACSSETSAPETIADPAFLPTGTYAQTIDAASCNVNFSFRSAERTAVFRNGPGVAHAVNVPMPVADETSNESLLGPRHDIPLTSKHAEIPRASGSCTATLDITELGAKRIAISYRQEECNGVPSCTVDYSLDLVEAACASDCEARSATLDVGADRSMRWRCDCQ